jgi:hypothetical protein
VCVSFCICVEFCIMNYNDFARGGTAPIGSKGKNSFAPAVNIVRPKTRAADNDFFDINVELRNNRAALSGMGNGDRSGDHAEIGQEPRRASSRGRSGRESGSKKSSIPSGALSAYTQNMTNIVLNVSKKNQRTSSATGSPRIVKDAKANLNQLNELRAAYGAAAIPISKSSSPARVKTGRSAYSDDNESRPSSHIDEPVEFSHEIVIEDEITPEGVYIPDKYHSQHSEYSLRTNEKPPKVMMSFSPSGTEGSPSVGRRPAKNMLDKASPSKSGRRSTDNLLVDSFNRKLNIRETPSPLSNYDTTPDIEILGSSRSDMAVNAEPLFGIPDEILLRIAPNSNFSPRGGEDAMIPLESSSQQQRKTESLLTSEDDRLEDYLDYSDNDEIGESCDGTNSRTASAKLSKLLNSANKRDNKDSNSAEIDDNGEDPKEYGAVPARPQSRKLYLDSERGSRPTPNIKAPRSAGARYGAHSPLKDSEEPSSNPEEVRKGAMKRLGSLDNLKSQIWEEKDHDAERPPSRQSSAFPVNLAHDNLQQRTSGASSAANAPGSASKNRKKPSSGTPTRGLQEGGKESPLFNNKYSPSSSHRSSTFGVDAAISSSLSGSPGTVPIIIPAVVPITVTSGGIPSAEMDPGAISNASVASNSYLSPNTELRSVKKSRAGGAASTVVEDEESVNSSYQKRPPSRQKIAAQHLFDDVPVDVAISQENASIGARPNSTRGGSRPGLTKNSSSDGSAVYVNPQVKPPPPSSAGASSRGLSARSQVNATRALTTRSKLYYDPKDDGFGELDSSNVTTPFLINVNYGASSQSSIEVISMGDDTNPTLRSTTAPAQQQSSPYRKATLTTDRLLTDKVINGRPRINPMLREGNVPISAMSSGGSGRTAHATPYSVPFEPPVLRPKPVSAGVAIGSSKGGLSGSGSAGKKKFSATSQHAETEYEKPDALRSASAGQGGCHHSSRGSNSHGAHISFGGKVPTRAAFGDWSEPDPRLIPRAQV